MYALWRKKNWPPLLGVGIGTYVSTQLGVLSQRGSLYRNSRVGCCCLADQSAGWSAAGSRLGPVRQTPAFRLPFLGSTATQVTTSGWRMSCCIEMSSASWYEEAVTQKSLSLWPYHQNSYIISTQLSFRVLKRNKGFKNPAPTAHSKHWTTLQRPPV